jgi:hypothetical protein
VAVLENAFNYSSYALFANVISGIAQEGLEFFLKANSHSYS